MQWGDTYMQGKAGPLAFVDRATGRRVRVQISVDDDHPGVSDSGDIEIRLAVSDPQKLRELIGLCRTTLVPPDDCRDR